jgi:hypothetical protein
MSGIVERSPALHVCRPGWRELDGGCLLPVRARIGDIWECDCGARFVAHDDPYNYATRGQRTAGSVIWKRERQPRRRWWRRG